MNMNKQVRMYQEYVSPSCTVVGLSSEGVLCGSVESTIDSFDQGPLPSYGSGLEDNGWY